MIKLYRDDPNEMPDFVAINEAKTDCKIIPKGDNLFAAVKQVQYKNAKRIVKN